MLHSAIDTVGGLPIEAANSKRKAGTEFCATTAPGPSRLMPRSSAPKAPTPFLIPSPTALCIFNVASPATPGRCRALQRQERRLSA
eukprot:s3924_g6.t1